MLNSITQAYGRVRQFALLILVLTPFAVASDGNNNKDNGETAGSSAPLEFKIADALVPPGGVYQLQVLLTEPKPMGMGSSGIMFSSSSFEFGIGASINSPSGQACGVVFPTSSGLQVAFVSPDATLGMNADYPILTFALQLTPDAAIGSQVPVSLNLANAIFLNGSGQPYTTESKPGLVTVGGTLNVNNILPGGSTAPAGSTISILGSGFTPSTIVQIENANVVTTQFVSSNEINVTLSSAIALNAVRVRVANGNELVTYYPYLRAAEVGQSARPLLATADPMFSQVTYTGASLPWITGTTVFTGLALQNPSSSTAEISLQLVSSNNNVLQTMSFPLAGRSKIVRDLVEFFGQPSGNAANVLIKSTQPVQMLGIEGDTSSNTLFPLIVTSL